MLSIRLVDMQKQLGLFLTGPDQQVKEAALGPEAFQPSAATQELGRVFRHPVVLGSEEISGLESLSSEPAALKFY